MTWSQVLENVLYFTNELLPSASKKNGWDKISLEQAISWASYCEKVSHKARLDLNVLPKLQYALTHASVGLTVSQLFKARELLFRSLLSNRQLNPDERLQLNQLMLEALGEEEAALIHKKVEQQNESCQELLQLLKSPQHELLAIKVKHSLLIEGPQKIDSKELKDLLVQVMRAPNGLMLLFRILDITSIKSSDENLLKCITEWLKSILMSGKCDTYKHVLVQFCNMSKEILCKGLHTHSTLLRPLLGAVRREARKLEPSYEGVKVTWVNKHGATFLINYSDITILCSNLLGDQILSVGVKKSFSDWAMQEDGIIWTSIFQNLKD